MPTENGRPLGDSGTRLDLQESRTHAAQAIPPPSFVSTMQPTLVADAPEGDQWLHEIKYSGYRTELLLNGVESLASTLHADDGSRLCGVDLNWSFFKPRALLRAEHVRRTDGCRDRRYGAGGADRQAAPSASTRR